jgi:4-hydroxybenzoate polyprenyltransferase
LAIYRRTAVAAEQNDVAERRDAGLVAALTGGSRGRWALLSVAQPGLAAVLALGGLPSLGVSVIGLMAAAAGFLALSALNDVLERRMGAATHPAGASRAGRRVVGPSRRLRAAAGGQLGLRPSLALILSLGGLSAVLAFVLAPRCLLIWGVAVGLDIVYCTLRSVTPWKTVVSGVMVGLGGLAGWVAVAPLSPRALTVFVFLALWQIGGRDIAGGVVDVDVDRYRGVTTVATVYGPLAAARAACVVGFVALAATVTLPMAGGTFNDLALAAGVLLLAWPGAKLWYSPTSAEAAAYRDRAIFYPAAVLLVALVPAVVRAL